MLTQEQALALGLSTRPCVPRIQVLGVNPDTPALKPGRGLPERVPGAFGHGLCLLPLQLLLWASTAPVWGYSRARGWDRRLGTDRAASSLSPSTFSQEPAARPTSQGALGGLTSWALQHREQV